MAKCKSFSGFVCLAREKCKDFFRITCIRRYRVENFFFFPSLWASCTSNFREVPLTV